MNGNFKGTFRNSDLDTRMILLNTYKIHPFWEFFFDVNKTQKEKFSAQNRELSSYMLSRYYHYSRPHFVDLKLPRFTISNQHNLVDTLKRFNVIDLLDKNVSDILGITDRGEFIRSIIQVVKLVVDESGETTRNKGLDATTRIIPKAKFYVDRPFTFYIYHHHWQIILLSSIITNPNGE
ncbi:Heparin cofactor 2 [Thelohanellus kitauei]|uniref:Heparin cofactor 2 n=1 Tax=Thelohanellus kitauei TaxID=669202 RepID=A0A0C2M3Q6_THEKT|nr:Heparin cofactor 2 [Thelohanellus kitauei]